MSLQTWNESLVVGTSDGPVLTTAARASCIPTANRIFIPPGYFYVGRALRFRLSGRISCAVTTPGTARFDICMGAAGTTIVFDTLAQNLNIIAKTNVPWYFEVTLVCRQVGAGAATTFFPLDGYFTSEAVVGSPLPTAGGNGRVLLPTGAPAVGAGMDNTAGTFVDVFFTQTVATGSLTVHNYQVDSYT